MLVNLLIGVLILYCLWCYKTILFGCGNCPKCRGEVYDPELEQLSGRLETLCRQRPIRMFFVKLFVHAPLIIFVGPLLMPIMAIKLYIDDRREAAQRRQHVDLTLAWTNPIKLPNAIRDYFEQYTPELEKIGFRYDGVYWMKPQRGDYYGALFLNQTGDTYATLAHLNGNYWCCFGSTFQSGCCLETCPLEATTESLKYFIENQQFTVVFTNDEDICSNYKAHQEKLLEIQTATGDRALVFEMDQLCDVLQYEGRIYSQQLFEFGDLDEPPPVPKLPKS